MKKSSLRRSMVALCAFGLLSMGMAGAVYAQKGPAAGNPKAKGDGSASMQGDISFKGQAAKTLNGRIFAHWADNPDGEILFGIQYWNTSEPAEVGNPPGRASDDRGNQALPDPLVACCAWGYQGGTEKNNPYAGWYTPQTTVRLAVKDKALMDQMTKAAQDFVAMQVTVSGHTVTGFKLVQ